MAINSTRAGFLSSIQISSDTFATGNVRSAVETHWPLLQTSGVDMRALLMTPIPSVTTEVHLSKAPNPQLLPRPVDRASGAIVCVH